MRDLYYYVAVSLDGFIAEPDGSFDKFVWDDEFVKDFFAAQKQFDTVLMGRKTYEVGLNQGVTNPYPHLKSYVISSTLTLESNAEVEVISSDVISFVEALKKQDGKPIWLCGGGNLAGQLMENGLIDRLTLKVNPIFLGKGIPLFGEYKESAALTLENVKEYSCGISERSYTIK